MRRHLAGHVDAAALALAHGLERRPGAHVRDVHVAADQFGNQDVAAGGDRLGDAGNALEPERGGHRAFVDDAFALQRRVLAVFDERHAEHPGVLHGAAGQQRRRDGMAVVADGDAAGLLQFGDVGQLLAFLPARHRPNRVDARQGGVGGLLQDELGDAGVVVDRLGVGHAGHGREATGDGRSHAGGDRLLVLLSGLAQVHVHVDETRTDHERRRQRHHLAAVGQPDGQIAADLGDDSAVDQHVVGAVHSIGRVHDPASLKQPLHCLLRRRQGDTARPSARPRRWPPGRESPRKVRRPLRRRSRRRD